MKPRKVENRWGRLEGFLSPEVKTALTQNYYKPDAKSIEARYIAIECERLYPREKEYRKLAREVEKEAKANKIVGSLESGICYSMFGDGKLSLVCVMALKKKRKRKAPTKKQSTSKKSGSSKRGRPRKSTTKRKTKAK